MASDQMCVRARGVLLVTSAHLSRQERAMPTICPSCGHKNIEGVDECENCGVDLRTVDLPKPVTKLEQTVMQLPLTALEMSTVHAVSPETTIEEVIHTLNRQKLDILEIIEDEKLIG